MKIKVSNRVLDRAFGHPRGVLGRVGGAVMARVNAAQEARAVAIAGLDPGQHVLIVGCGPGVGLQLAAEAAPGAVLVGIDPSQTMRALAARRLAGTAARVQVRAGTAEATGCAASSIDAAISVNNVMLWHRSAAFAELFRVLRSGSPLVISVHQHVLDISAHRLTGEVTAAGFTLISSECRTRRFNSPAVEILARRAAT